MGILIGIAIVERALYIKKNKLWEKTKWLMGFFIGTVLIITSYFITDTGFDTIYVSITMIMFLVMASINNRHRREWINFLTYIVGFPIIEMIYQNNQIIDYKIINY